jgi:hypothetical protein
MYFLGYKYFILEIGRFLDPSFKFRAIRLVQDPGQVIISFLN